MAFSASLLSHLLLLCPLLSLLLLPCPHPRLRPASLLHSSLVSAQMSCLVHPKAGTLPHTLSHFLPHACMRAKSLQSCLTLCDTRHFCPWDSPGVNTGVGCCTLLQGGLSDPGIEPAILVSCTGRQVLYHECHLGSPLYRQTCFLLLHCISHHTTLDIFVSLSFPN